MNSVWLLALAAAGLAQAPDVSGLWLGTLNGGGGLELRIALHINNGLNGLTGKMDSLDQGAKGITMSNVKLDAGEFSFDIPMISGKYKGALSADRQRIEGMWTQGPASLPLAFGRVKELPESKPKPQEPKRPYPYDEIEVSYENAQQKAKLAGTLTVPRNRKPAPAVILISGSGAQDRDESIFGHKPFLVLADHLTRRGIVVLRVDDRGKGGSTGDVANATTLDFATDVQAAIAFLKTRDEVDKSRIGLIGHSEGGIIAPIVASQSKDVAFAVLLAATGVPGEQVLREQVAAITKSKAQPTPPSTPWFRTFLKLDPAEYLRKLTCPVLVMNGELDLQVLPWQNLPAIARALEDARNRDYTIVKLPKLNHLFQTATTGMPQEYQNIEETFAPVALETISNWISAHTN